MSCDTKVIKTPGGWIIISKLYTYDDVGSSWSVDMGDWLGQAVSAIKALATGRGKVVCAGFLCDGSAVVDASADLPGWALADHFGQVNVADKWGPRISLTSGLSMQIMSAVEDPTAYLPADLTKAGTRSFTNFYPFPGLRSLGQAAAGVRDSEYAWDLDDLREGSISISLNEHVGDPGAGADIVGSTTYQLVAVIREEPFAQDASGKVVAVPYGWRCNHFDYPITSNTPTNTIGKDEIVEALLFHVGIVGQRTGAVLDTSAQINSSPFGILKPTPAGFLSLLMQQARRWAGGFANTQPVFSDGTVIPISFPFPDRPTSCPVITDAGFSTSQTFGSGGFTAANNPRMLVRQLGAKPNQDAKCDADLILVKPLTGAPFRVGSLPSKAQAIFGPRLPALLNVKP